MFDSTKLALPLVPGKPPAGALPLTGHNLSVIPIPSPRGTEFMRKLHMLFVWLPVNIMKLWGMVAKADAVHTPIPGDVGLIGTLIAHVQRKPLFVRHCGNWLNADTSTRRFIQWYMVHYAGGKRVMYATGYNSTPPSKENPNIDWIFSTSLTENQLKAYASNKSVPDKLAVRLITVCRQVKIKGVDTAIRAASRLAETYNVTLSVLGEGEDLEYHKRVAKDEGIENTVHFMGNQPHPVVMEEFGKADVFLFVTRSSEGFPKAVLEGLASGLPTISTAVSVIPILLKNGAGTIVEPLAVDDIVQAIRSYIDDEQVYMKASQAAVEAASAYSLESWVSTIRTKLEASWNVSLRHDISILS